MFPCLQLQLAAIVLSRQEKRKFLISSYCKKTKSSPVLLPTGSLLNHLIVDNKHKILYCYIPKIACTTWKKIMTHLLGIKNNRSVHSQHFPLLGSYSKSKVRYILHNYYKFMFVRDPFERLLSAYKDKFTRQSDYVSKKYSKKIQWTVRERLGSSASVLADKQEIKFSDFILYLIDVNSKGGRYNEHWQHYDNLCHPCKIKYDFIGHYETLEEDARFVLHHTGVDRFVSFPPVRFTSTKDKLAQYYSKLPRKDLLQLQRIYQRDFEMFGYNKIFMGSQ